MTSLAWVISKCICLNAPQVRMNYRASLIRHSTCSENSKQVLGPSSLAPFSLELGSFLVPVIFLRRRTVMNSGVQLTLTTTNQTGFMDGVW